MSRLGAEDSLASKAARLSANPPFKIKRRIGFGFAAFPRKNPPHLLNE
ncbi:hypothetical protein [Marinilabilia salmonicolor]|jgi:hypothetical protein|nr:hypothetical protein [Marinilabilia salmonicolor]